MEKMHKSMFLILLISYSLCHYGSDYGYDYGGRDNYDSSTSASSPAPKSTVVVTGVEKPVATDKIQLNVLEFGQVTLLADNGKYLARCQQCGDAKYIDSAGVHITDPSLPWAIWTIEIVGNKVAFKADSGKYLARCENCWNKAIYKDTAFVHVTDLENKPWALWTPVYMGGRKWAFQSDVGYYLARCQSCVTGGKYPNFAFTHSSNPKTLYSQWQVSYVFPKGPISLQMSTGKYLTRCANCGPASFSDSASVHQVDYTNPSIFWNIEKIGNQIAFVADSGRYLARCNNCWNRSTYPDAVFVYPTTAKGNQFALWTPFYIGSGRWVFRSSNGKYLTRCQSCVNGGIYSQFAFVHEADYTNPNAQWWLVAACA